MISKIIAIISPIISWIFDYIDQRKQNRQQIDAKIDKNADEKINYTDEEREAFEQIDEVINGEKR